MASSVIPAKAGIYKPYPEYKDSGVKWLGKVPNDWKLSPLKYLASFSGGGTPSKEKPEYWNGDIPWVSPKDMKSSRIKSTIDNVTENAVKESSTNLLDEGALLMVVRSGILQHSIPVAINDVPVTLNQDMKALRFNGRFNVQYAMQVITGHQKLLLLEWGKQGATVESIEQEYLANTVFPVPPILEQEKIANFLDHETAKIDTLIEKQQQLIQLLKEKRQAVISHAVTKGLNPNAKMRDSSVEWLGEVPEHWEVVPIKHLCSLLKDGTHLPPPRVDSGAPLLSVRNIIDGKFVFRDDDSNISEKDYEDLCRSFIPQVGDVILAIVGGTIGKVAIIEEMTKFHIQRSVAIFRAKKNVLTSDGLANIIGSSNFQSLLWENVGFSAQPGIYLGALANFRLPIPPLDEQVEINKYCALKAERIDVLISKATSAVKLIQERRTALISAAVTGKIDVRNWQAPLDSRLRGNDEGRENDANKEVAA